MTTGLSTEHTIIPKADGFDVVVMVRAPKGIVLETMQQLGEREQALAAWWHFSRWLQYAGLDLVELAKGAPQVGEFP